MPHRDINRVVLVGRLTRDPELRATPTGTSICSLRIATNGARREASGEYAERPNFLDVSVFGPPGDAVAANTRKGARVAIDGRLEWREWESADHGRRQAVTIVAESVQFLEPRGAHAPAGEDADTEDRELAGADDEDLAF